MMMTIEGHIEIGDPLREGDIQIKMGNPVQRGYLDRGPPGEGYPHRHGRPPGRGGY